MNKAVAIIASTALFALIGLLAGYLAIRNLTGSGSSHDFLVIVLAIVPTIGGALLGGIVGYIAT